MIDVAFITSQEIESRGSSICSQEQYKGNVKQLFDPVCCAS